jgi:hypothetical protein
MKLLRKILIGFIVMLVVGGTAYALGYGHPVALAIQYALDPLTKAS